MKSTVNFSGIRQATPRNPYVVHWDFYVGDDKRQATTSMHSNDSVLEIDNKDNKKKPAFPIMNAANWNDKCFPFMECMGRLFAKDTIWHVTPLFVKGFKSEDDRVLRFYRQKSVGFNSGPYLFMFSVLCEFAHFYDSKWHENWRVTPTWGFGIYDTKRLTNFQDRQENFFHLRIPSFCGKWVKEATGSWLVNSFTGQNQQVTKSLYKNDVVYIPSVQKCCPSCFSDSSNEPDFTIPAKERYGAEYYKKTVGTIEPWFYQFIRGYVNAYVRDIDDKVSYQEVMKKFEDTMAEVI